MLKVFFHYCDRTLPLSNKLKIRRFIEWLFKLEKTHIKRIDFIFCSDEFLLNINRIFLHHDFYTDIITFDLGNSKILIEGEIYISVDRVRQNALTFKVNKEEEFLRVIIHGALHLCNYSDKTKKELHLMRQKEDRYLKLFSNFSD